ncbi:hypothetical protein [Haloarchaeobius baliensis]|uniref:hypothetical protein n=1 Tax=Haloarchaeobius baliensis TaxID=1670458 RepID=UPI003F8803A0
MRRRTLLALGTAGITGGVAVASELLEPAPRPRLVQVAVENHDTQTRSVNVRLAKGDAISFEQSVELDGATDERVDEELIAPPAFESRPANWWVGVHFGRLSDSEWQSVEDLAGQEHCYKVVVEVHPGPNPAFRGSTDGQPCEPDSP